ncbi:MAG: hypothetical protein ACOC2U_02735 [bacterium]
MRVNFNNYLYQKIRKIRSKYGLSVSDLNIKIDHPLVGERIVNYKGKVGTIESVHKLWDRGWYIVLLINNGKNSHWQVLWENINCQDSKIVEIIEIMRQKYFIVDTSLEKDSYALTANSF